MCYGNTSAKQENVKAVTSPVTRTEQKESAPASEITKSKAQLRAERRAKQVKDFKELLYVVISHAGSVQYFVYH